MKFKVFLFFMVYLFSANSFSNEIEVVNHSEEIHLEKLTVTVGEQTESRNVSGNGFAPIDLLDEVECMYGDDLEEVKVSYKISVEIAGQRVLLPTNFEETLEITSYQDCADRRQNSTHAFESLLTLNVDAQNNITATFGESY